MTVMEYILPQLAKAQDFYRDWHQEWIQLVQPLDNIRHSE